METEFYGDGQHNGGVGFWGNNNPYIYTYQNPIIYVDPNGKQTKVTDFCSGFFEGVIGYDPKDPNKNTLDTGRWHKYDKFGMRIPENRNQKYGNETGRKISEKAYELGVKTGVIAGIFIEVIEPSPVGEAKAGGKILINSLDELIEAAGKFTTRKTSVAENVIKANIDDVFETLTKDAVKTTEGGAKVLKDGRVLHKHKSTRTDLHTISIDEAEKKQKKIRFKN
ncbi:MAG: hypothetical protein K0M56_04040 [Kaistella sp.]|nr:hypothetical protein [Kaistella sp.]